MLERMSPDHAWWHDIISTADLRHSKLKATIIILKNTLRSVYIPAKIFFAFKRMSSSFWWALTFLFTIFHASVLRKFRAKKKHAGLVRACWCALTFSLYYVITNNKSHTHWQTATITSRKRIFLRFETIPLLLLSYLFFCNGVINTN